MMAKVMSKMKSDVKLNMAEGENADRMAADLITDGCNMGVKSLYKYLNQYPAADGKIKQLAKNVAQAEDTLVKELRDYL